MQFSLLARFSRILAMHRARVHRSQKICKDGTRSGPVIFDTLGIFERDPRAFARTPSRLFHCPNSANAFSGRDRLDPASGECDLVHGKAGAVAGFSQCSEIHRRSEVIEAR